jgi:sugar O-acyltransferase (sialic acid O-acetyltransferase NeuD family)
LQEDTRVISEEENAGIAACKRKLVIIGAGGFGAIVASVVNDINANATANGRLAFWGMFGYADADAAKRGTHHHGYTVHGTVEDVDQIFQGRELWFFCAIGENKARAKVAGIAEERGWKPATLIHPAAILSSNVEVGAGSYVGPLSVTSVNTKIGAHAIVDMHVSIGHDAILKDFCSVYPGARISGRCCVGRYAVVGSNATLLPGTIVGERSVVGASSLASCSIEPDTTLLGVPAQIIYRRRHSPPGA